MQTTFTSNQYLTPKRRRIYLMRHGDVAYFGADGQPVADLDIVVLSEKGRAPADAAGHYFPSLGIKRFDRVISSSLPRTIETARRVTAAYGQPVQPNPWEALREMVSGHPDAITTDLLSHSLDGKRVISPAGA